MGDVDAGLAATGRAAERVFWGGVVEATKEPVLAAIRAPDARLLPPVRIPAGQPIRGCFVAQIRQQHAPERHLPALQPFGNRTFREAQTRGNLGEGRISDVPLDKHGACRRREQRQGTIEQVGQLRAFQLDLHATRVGARVLASWRPL
jgi:hypothetical protein